MTSIQRPITSTLPDRLLPGRLQTELDRLIAYLWQHEEADYLARSEHERSHHVFESVWLLDHWFYGHSVEHSLADPLQSGWSRRRRPRRCSPGSRPACR